MHYSGVSFVHYQDEYSEKGAFCSVDDYHRDLLLVSRVPETKTFGLNARDGLSQTFLDQGPAL